jgi:putative endonuclease
MTSESAVKGSSGEAVAAAYLLELGWQILKTNYHCRYGEIDIVARTVDDALVFVEVKTYHHHGLSSGRDAMTVAKQRRLVQSMQHFLGYQCLDFEPQSMRIDLILATPAVVLEHLQNVVGGDFLF